MERLENLKRAVEGFTATNKKKNQLPQSCRAVVNMTPEEVAEYRAASDAVETAQAAVLSAWAVIAEDADTLDVLHDITLRDGVLWEGRWPAPESRLVEVATEILPRIVAREKALENMGLDTPY